jgi:hypothetical protein
MTKIIKFIKKLPMKTIYLSLIAFCLLLSACVQPLKYVGEKSTPTKSVDVVTSASDIKKPYKVVGHLTIHKYPPETMRKYLAKEAKKYGGDAIVVPSDSTMKSMHGSLTVDVLKYE